MIGGGGVCRPATPLPTRRRARGLLLAAVIGISTLADADPASPQFCQIAMEFSVNGRTVASPNTVVEFGKEAEITVSRDGASGWHFAILADEPTVVHRVSAIPIEIAIYELVNGQAILRASPHLRMTSGQRADLDTTFGEDDGRNAHLAVVANLRADAPAESGSDDAVDGTPPG